LEAGFKYSAGVAGVLFPISFKKKEKKIKRRKREKKERRKKKKKEKNLTKSLLQLLHSCITPSASTTYPAGVTFRCTPAHSCNSCKVL